MEQFYRKPGLQLDVNKSKPFRVCFADKIPLGRSKVQIGKPLKIGPIIPLKFYDPRNDKINEKLVEKYLNILKTDQHGKSPAPFTENQKYGFYQVRLTDTDFSDRRLFAHKRTNIIVREHLMNYTKIR